MSELASYALLAFMLIVAPIALLLIIRMYMSRKDDYYDTDYPSKQYIVKHGEDSKVIGLNESFNIELTDALMNEHDFTFEQATEIYNHLCKYGHSYGPYHIIEEAKILGGLIERLLNIE